MADLPESTTRKKRRKRQLEAEGVLWDAPVDPLTDPITKALYNTVLRIAALPSVPPPNKGTVAITQVRKPTDFGPWQVGKSRRPAVNAFISRMAEDGYKIRRKDIVMAGQYTDSTEFQRYQRGHPDTTKTAIARFDEILGLEPQEFMWRLGIGKPIVEKKKAQAKAKRVGE